MNRSKVKVLITDDSVVYRSQIRSALESMACIEVVGTAPNGRVAIQKLETLATPASTAVDLVILDLEMPEMDGLATLAEIKSHGWNCKVLVFSSTSKRGAESTLEALRLGATDFVTKPNGQGDGFGLDPMKRILASIGPKIEALFPEAAAQAASSLSTTPVASTSFASPKYPHVIWELLRPKLVVIGSSTGGPTVLETIFSQIRGPLLCPIVIAQHMPPLFTATVAERLSRVSGLPVREAKHGEILKNEAYMAPGDFHLRLEGTIAATRLMLDQGPQVNFVRPAVDPLFESAAQIFKDKCLAFVLTGMGADGAAGAHAIKQAGGGVVIQDKSSCVVFGMPGAVCTSGAFDRILSPKEIIEVFHQKVASMPIADVQVSRKVHV